MRDTLLVVVGPTASGKTGLAVRLAELVDGEIIGADSVQIYRAFDVGSGKPTAEELGRAPHHLVDSIDPHAPMDAAVWTQAADQVIADVRARGKQPIVCGGTFLWVKALLYGLAAAPPADQKVRRRHREEAERAGREALHQRLAGVDAPSAAKLSPNDLVRVSRALEVYELSGIPLSQWHELHGFREPRYASKLLGVQWPREQLDRRIYDRTTHMLDAGWVAEVRWLFEQGYAEARAMRSVGYRQIAEALSESADLDLDELRDRIYRATRVFARRQRTWLRDQPVEWLTFHQASGDLEQWLSSARPDSG